MTNSAAPLPDDLDDLGSLHLPVGALSPSRANDFMSCPLKFRYRTIDRIPEPPSAAAARGTLVHGALEDLFDRHRDDRTPEAATEVLPRLWQDMLAGRPELADLPEASDTETWFAAAGDLVRSYFRLEDPRRFDPAGREVRLQVSVVGGVPVRGIVDRLDQSPDGLIRIVDYKTGRSPRTDFADEAMFQLKFYALMLLRLRGVIVAKLRLIYLGDGQILEYTPDQPDLEAFERRIEALWHGIESARRTGEFPSRRSRLCDWCFFQDICPEFGGTPPSYPGWPPAATPGALSAS